MSRYLEVQRKVGQLFMVGFAGTEVTDEIRRLIEEFSIGGVIYFKRNIRSLEQIQMLCEGIRQIAEALDPSLPIYQAIDQEWGLVNRFPDTTITPIQGAMAIGATGTGGLHFSDSLGMLTGRLLHTLGMNLNFAPVLDLATSPRNPQVRTRAFHQQYPYVTRFADAFSEAMISQGVFPCLKHFPGLGDALVDTHLGGAEVTHSLEALFQREIRPFEKLIPKHYGFLMVSHAIFPDIDPSRLPSSLSPVIIDTLLRQRMGYEGIVVSDDLDMGAVSAVAPLEEACVMALKAGVDMLLICHSTEKVPGLIDAITDRVLRGELDEDIIDRAYDRHLAAKEELPGMTGTSSRSLQDFRHAAAELARDIAVASVNVTGGNSALLPLGRKRGNGIVVLAPRRLFPHLTAEAFEDFAFTQRLCEYHPCAEICLYPLETPDWEKVISAEYLMLLSQDTLFHSDERDFVTAALSECDGMKVLVNLGQVGDTIDMGGYDVAVCTYSASDASLRAAAELIACGKQSRNHSGVVH